MRADDARAHEVMGEHPPGRAAERLSHLIPALWKVLTRAAQGSNRLPAIESQVSILRRVVDLGPASPAELADELYLARPTISNLLKDLETEGLVDRSPSPSDGRSVSVSPTPYGRAVLGQFRRDRTAVLTQVLGELTADEQARIEAALPDLERLLQRLGDAARLPAAGSDADPRQDERGL